MLPTLIVFIMFWAQATLLVALVSALATIVASAFLLTLMFGSGWITRARCLLPNSRRPS
jgi:ABC-type transport system involved in cytochrome bd biosynthesis fused ATPase/permease subunit